MQGFIPGTFAAAALGVAVLATPASAQIAHPQAAVQIGEAGAFAQQVQYRRHGRHHRHHRHWRHRRGPAIGAGIATGLILGGALAAQSRARADAAVEYCMQRFRSYDPARGTYLGYDGRRHPCP